MQVLGSLRNPRTGDTWIPKHFSAKSLSLLVPDGTTLSFLLFSASCGCLRVSGDTGWGDLLDFSTSFSIFCICQVVQLDFVHLLLLHTFETSSKFREIFVSPDAGRYILPGP